MSDPDVPYREVDLPVVVVTSVIRSANQGQSHGGVYLVDLDSVRARQVIDWNEGSISWEGRGGDRGLRGIAFWDGEVYLAASDEVFVYDSRFRPSRSFGNRYLKHCHEIHADGGFLYLASAGFDSVLRYDLSTGRFVTGYCLRYQALSRLSSKLSRRAVRPGPALRTFDPEGPQGPPPGDTCHVNNVICVDGRLYVSGTQLGRIYEVTDGGLRAYGRVPLGTHNARPLDGGTIMNNTAADTVVRGDRNGDPRLEFPVPRYESSRLENTELAAGEARQAFGRGLSVYEKRYVITGSSPATVSVHDMETGRTLRSVNLSMDVRNAIHGLEVWPFFSRLPRSGDGFRP